MSIVDLASARLRRADALVASMCPPCRAAMQAALDAWRAEVRRLGAERERLQREYDEQVPRG